MKAVSERTVSPEDSLLLSCIQVFHGSSSPEQVRESVQRRIDWDLVLRIASWHGVTPILHTVLQEYASDLLSADTLRQLHAGFQSNAHQNLFRTADLRRVLEILIEQNLPAVPFKGPALATLAYGSLSLREFCDLDILVRPQDLQSIIALLQENGYRTDLPPDPARRQAYLRSRHEVHFVSPGGTLIELHQTFLPPFACFDPDYSSLWNRLEPVRLGGVETWSLPLENMLLVLCAHGAKHCWARLGWICDIAALLSRHAERLDWSQI